MICPTSLRIGIASVAINFSLTMMENASAKSALKAQLDQYEDLLYDDPHEAVKVYQSILEQTSPTDDLHLWLRTIVKLNSAKNHIGDMTDYPETLEKALPLAASHSLHLYLAQLLIQKIAVTDLTSGGDEISRLLAQAEHEAKLSGDKTIEAIVYIYQAREANRRGQIDIAASFTHKAFQSLKQAPKDARYYAMLNNLSTVTTAGNTQKLDQSLEMLKEVTDFTSQRQLRFLGVLGHYNYAKALIEAKLYDDAQKHFEKSARDAEGIDDELGIAYGLAGIAEINKKKGEFPAAIENFEKARKIFAKYDDQGAIIDTDIQLSFALNENNQSERAFELIANVREKIEKRSTPNFLAYVLEVEGRILENLQQTQKAMLNYKEIVQLQQEIFKEKNQELANRYYAEFEVERQEERNRILAQENQIQFLEIESKKRTTIFMIAALLLSGLVLALILFDFFRVKKRNEKISALNKYIETNVLQRFLPPVLVQEILEGRSRLDDHAKTEIVTVIFADLCEFTRATDRLGANLIAKILNDFFYHMTDVIFEEGGTIDKFIGDAIMIIYGAPNHMEAEDQVKRAIHLAHRMQDKLIELNRHWELTENQHFEMRIGIHQGQAVVGSFGGSKRSDYTVVGSSVNIAARVEGLAEPNTILATEAIVRHLPNHSFEMRGHFRIRGLNKEMPLFRILQDSASSSLEEVHHYKIPV